jgi:hypothetical protein
MKTLLTGATVADKKIKAAPIRGVYISLSYMRKRRAYIIASPCRINCEPRVRAAKGKKRSRYHVKTAHRFWIIGELLLVVEWTLQESVCIWKSVVLRASSFTHLDAPIWQLEREAAAAQIVS